MSFSETLPVLTAAVAPPRRSSVQRTPTPVYDIPDEDLERKSRRRTESRRGTRASGSHAIPIFFILVGLLGALAHDIVKIGREGDKSTSAGDDLGLDDEFTTTASGTIDVQFHDKDVIGMLGNTGMKPAAGEFDPEAVRVYWEPSMRFGLVMKEDKVERGREPKRLTFKENGLTNNTCIRLDGQQWLFGEKPFRTEFGQRRPAEDWPGRWLERDGRLGQGRDEKERIGRRSVWYYDAEQVKVTQLVEVVRGPQTGRLDTCIIRYKIENGDQDRAHRVGIRFLLDTFIGSNDGVPFLIPGQRELCTTKLGFRPPAKVPDFIQALEKEDLTNPGTVAQIQLKVGGGLEPPTAVTLGAYPNPRLASVLGDRLCRQEKTMWDVPVHPIKTLPPGDSAVTLYWDEQSLEPGTGREVGFSYGLGRVAGRQGKGKLALTVGGSFKAGEEFTATAYVSHPQPGQTVKLILPEDFELVEGDGAATQTVPMPPQGAARPISPVTWRIRSPRQQVTAELEAKLSTGPSQKVQVKITRKTLFGD